MLVNTQLHTSLPSVDNSNCSIGKLKNQGGRIDSAEIRNGIKQITDIILIADQDAFVKKLHTMRLKMC